MENEHTPALQGDIRWHHYNYPPLLKLIHFVPKELPHNKKFIVMSMFLIHLVVLANTILNFFDGCLQGGLKALYAFLFILFVNPLMLYIFERGFMGICKEKSRLKMYIILQPIVTGLLLLISLVNVFGFNGFMRASHLFGQGHGFAGILSVLVSLVFLAAGLLSAFIYVRVLRQKEALTSDL